MTEASQNPKSFSVFAVLMGLCAASHVSVHLARIELTVSWLLGVSVFCWAMWLIYRPSVWSFLVLSILQIASVVVDAPYNPDHWLLVLFVNVLALGAAWRVWRKGELVTPQRLIDTLAPASRLVFLTCYGFAALSKYNRDFLFSDNSVARELLGHQIGVMPILSWLVWPAAVPWLTLVCETAIPLLLLSGRTRHLGVSVGLLFHAALMISPAVAVYDFTIAVYMMLYLFTPSGFENNVAAWWSRMQQHHPDLCRGWSRYRWCFSVIPAVVLLVVSLKYSMGDLTARLTWIRWDAAMAVVGGAILLGGIGLYSSDRQSTAIRWLPRWPLPYAVLGLALLNGLCPYLGLKTQGSFTMFSNLRTEAGDWNHLIVPQAIRIVDHYQDRLVHITATSDPILNSKYVSRGLLATEFEVRRRISTQPEFSLTLLQGGHPVVVDPATDPVLGAPLDLLSRKLLIFRPVSPDGEPFTSN